MTTEKFNLMKFLYAVILIIILSAFIFAQNNVLEITRIRYKSCKVPAAFNNYRIVHLSDLHEKKYGKGNWILVYVLKSLKPDLIAITGDLINYRHHDNENTLGFLGEIRKIAPVYYVTGNHEIAYSDFPSFENEIKKMGIEVLHNTSETITRNRDTFSLIGIDDPITTDVSEKGFVREYLKLELDKAIGSRDESNFRVLLCHRPEEFPLYTESKTDLILSGHAHGGQIRLPFAGGLFAPGQGFFPKYTGGKYTGGNSTMIVSRGIGNSSFPLRVFNRPEIILVTLKKSGKTG